MAASKELLTEILDGITGEQTSYQLGMLNSFGQHFKSF